MSIAGFIFRKLILGLCLLTLFVCGCHKPSGELSAKEISAIRDSVRFMLVNISGDLAAKGPIAWTRYFENDPAFFMASDGGLAFRDFPSAKSFIEEKLTKNIKHIDLHWDHVRIDPVAPGFASIGADYHEDLTDSASKIISSDGYFTGTAARSSAGWKLRNAHWSIIKHKDS